MRPATAPGEAPFDVRDMIPEEFHPELLDEFARTLAHGEEPPEKTESLRKAREIAAWRKLHSVAEGNPLAWQVMQEFLVDTARNFIDELVVLANDDDGDSRNTLGKVKARSGAAFGVFAVARALSLANLRRKARLGNA